MIQKIILLNSQKKYFLLQRNNYLTSIQKKIRKIFGRYLFTNIFVLFFNPIHKLNKKINHEFQIEFNELTPYLPNIINNVLDIGSGLGVIDTMISNNINKNAKFTLIDKDHIEKKVFYGFNIQSQFYNSFKETNKFLLNNGILKENFNLISVENKSKINIKFDLVISLLSLGYHYPLNEYLKTFQNNTHKNTYFIFDIANEYNNFIEVKNFFNSVKVIKKSSEIRHNYLRICCVGFKKIN